MKKQRVRVELPSGGQVEVDTVDKANELYPDGKVLYVVTLDDLGNPTYEHHGNTKRKDDVPLEVSAKTTAPPKEEAPKKKKED